MEVARRRGRRRKKLLDDLKDRRGYSRLKEEALDRTMWRNRFGGGFGPVVRQKTEWWMMMMKHYMFRAFLCPSSGVLYCTFDTGKFHAGFDDRFQAESGCNSVPSWLCLETVIKTCMKLTSAECTVENSWLWAEGTPETCRVVYRINLDN